MLSATKYWLLYLWWQLFSRAWYTKQAVTYPGFKTFSSFILTVAFDIYSRGFFSCQLKHLQFHLLSLWTMSKTTLWDAFYLRTLIWAHFFWGLLHWHNLDENAPAFQPSLRGFPQSALLTTPGTGKAPSFLGGDTSCTGIPTVTRLGLSGTAKCQLLPWGALSSAGAVVKSLDKGEAGHAASFRQAQRHWQRPLMRGG